MPRKPSPKKEPPLLEKLNLKSNPFEPQGEFIGTISRTDTKLRVDELNQCNHIIDMARSEGNLIAAVVKGEPSSGKTALANKLIERSHKYHPKTAHIYVKMESGSFDDPFFILSLIIDRLQDATKKLKQSKVDECLAKALDLPFQGLTIEKSQNEDIRKATYLMSLWYGYINALTSVGEHDCVVIHIDEVEDRWGTATITTNQLERDLKYLRDLLGYIQEGEIDQKFPVALFLYMTEASYVHIGGVNNALKSRLERTIPLQPFNEKDALEFVKSRLQDKRINNKNVDEFNPFTRDGILTLIATSKDEKGLFSWRKFIISCHDILHFYRLEGGIIDKSRVRDWIGRSPRPLPPGPDVGPGASPQLIDPFDDIEFSKLGRKRADDLIERGFLENTELQLQHTMKNVDRFLHDCSNHFVKDKDGSLVFTIAGEKAKIPISIKMGNESKLKNDFFCVYFTNNGKRSVKNSENEFTIRLPDSPKMMIRYALYDSTYISEGDLAKARDQISSQINELNEKIMKIFEKYKHDHYIPHLLGSKLQTEENFESFISELENLSKYDIKRVNIDFLTDCGFFDRASFTIPRWYTQIISSGTFVPKDLWKNTFFFNLEKKPIEAAVNLLKRLEITDGMRLRSFEDRKNFILKKIDENIKSINKIIHGMRETGENYAESAIHKTNSFGEQLNKIEKSINSFNPKDNIFTNFIELYQNQRQLDNVALLSDSYVKDLQDVLSQYRTRKKTIEVALGELENLKISNPDLEKKLTELLEGLNGVFERPDMVQYMKVTKQDYEILFGESTQFCAKSTQLVADINNFKFKQLEIAVEKGLIEDDLADLKENWGFIQKINTFNEIESTFNELRGKYAELEAFASEHKNQLSTQFTEGNIILKNCEKFVSEQNLKDIRKVIDNMGEKIDSCSDLIKQDQLIESLQISVDSDFESLGPILKSMFKPDKDYSVQTIAEEFNLDETRSKSFIKFLEENQVLTPLYRVTK